MHFPNLIVKLILNAEQCCHHNNNVIGSYTLQSKFNSCENLFLNTSH